MTQAGFLHGRFVWANWDVEELLEMKEKIEGDLSLLKIGITGAGARGPKDLFDCTVNNPMPK